MKLILWIIVWITLSELLIWVTPKSNYPNKPEFFEICVMRNHQPRLITLDKYQPNQTLCPEIHFSSDDSPLRFDLKYFSQDNVWELTTSNDSLSDPHTYRYVVENQKITPLTHTYGGMATKVSSYVMVFVFMALMSVLWSLGRWLWKKFRPHAN